MSTEQFSRLRQYLQTRVGSVTYSWNVETVDAHSVGRVEDGGVGLIERKGRGGVASFVGRVNDSYLQRRSIVACRGEVCHHRRCGAETDESPTGERVAVTDAERGKDVLCKGLHQFKVCLGDRARAVCDNCQVYDVQTHDGW